MIAERFAFPNAGGDELAAVLDLPKDRRPRAYALFAHCFTCGKDFVAARRIAAALTTYGWGVLRFDFTGLGESEGELSGFGANVEDLLAAAAALRRSERAPSLLIGHSLGGAAVLAAAGRLPEVEAVVTVAAPADPTHVLRHIGGKEEELEAQGFCTVQLAGRPFRITRDFVRETAGQTLLEHVRALDAALFIFHAPEDDEVSVDNAAALFGAARHPKSFLSLAGANHLLTRPGDATYVANVIAAAVERYLPEQPA